MKKDDGHLGDLFGAIGREMVERLGFHSLQWSSMAEPHTGDAVIRIMGEYRIRASDYHLALDNRKRMEGLLRTALQPLIDDVFNSPVTQSILEDRERQISTLRKDLETLGKKVVELSCYEQYYKLALKMNGVKE